MTRSRRDRPPASDMCIEAVTRVAGVLVLAMCLAIAACADDSYVIGFGAVDAGPSWDEDPKAQEFITLGKEHLAKAGCSRGPPTCPGATWPDFAAPDFQPVSPFKANPHGLEVFKGRIVIVAMLAAW